VQCSAVQCSAVQFTLQGRIGPARVRGSVFTPEFPLCGGKYTCRLVTPDTRPQVAGLCYRPVSGARAEGRFPLNEVSSTAPQ
jgi:hypothetical protein